MPRPDEVKKLIRKVGDNPALVDQLLNANNMNRENKKRTIRDAGLQDVADNPPSRQELIQEIEKLLTPSGAGVGAPGSSQRIVEWIGAIATAAAGAMAA